MPQHKFTLYTLIFSLLIIKVRTSTEETTRGVVEECNNDFCDESDCSRSFKDDEIACENKVQRLNRVERAPVQATATSSTTTISSNEVQLILSRKDANPTKTICQGQAWSISADITLPPGKHELTIEIFAPRKEFDYIGYIQYFGISSTDKTIISYTTNEKKEYFVNQKVFRQLSLKVTNITVKDQPASATPAGFHLKFASILWTGQILMQDEEMHSGIIIHAKGIIWCGILRMIYSTKCPEIPVEMSIASHPQVMFPADISPVTAEVFLPVMKENYTFSVYSVGQTATISSVNLIKGGGFIKNDSITELKTTQDEVIGRSIITRRMNIYVENLENPSGLNYFVSRESKTVKIVAYIQIIDKPTTRAIIGFRLQVGFEKVIFKECSISIIADYKDIKGSPLPYTIQLVEPKAEVEKLAEIKMRLDIPPDSKQIYSLQMKFIEYQLGEICYTSISDVGSGIKNRISGMRLYTVYPIQGVKQLRSKANIYLGILENPTNSSRDHFIELIVGIKPRQDNSRPEVMSTTLETTLSLYPNQTEKQSILFPVLNSSTAFIPSDKNPQVSIELQDPVVESPTVNHYATLLAVIKWFDAIVYRPVKIHFHLSTADSVLVEQKFCSLGRAVTTAVPVNAEMLITKNFSQIKFPSIYVKPVVNNSEDSSITIKYVIYFNEPKSVKVTFNVFSGIDFATKQLTLTPTDYTFPAAVLPNQQPLGNLGNMLISRRDSYLHPDSFTFIMASIILSPKSRQSYKMSIETSKAPQEVEMFIPKFLDTGLSIFSGGSQLSVINNTANVMLANHQFAAIHNIEGGISKSEATSINVLIPLSIGPSISSPINMKLMLTDGNHTAETAYKFHIGATLPLASDIVSSETYQIDIFDFDDQPEYLNYSLTPGEIGRIYNRIIFNVFKCAQYRITFSITSRSTWPADILDIIILDNSTFMWIPNLSDYQVNKSTGAGSQTVYEASIQLKICAAEGFGNEMRIDLLVRPWSRNFNQVSKIQQTVEITGKIETMDRSSTKILTPTILTISPEISMKEYILNNSDVFPDGNIFSIKAETIDKLPRGPGDTVEFIFDIRIPEYTKLPNLTLIFNSGEINGENESVFTILNVDVNNDSSIMALQTENAEVAYSSKYLNGQQDIATVNFGDLVNPGNFAGRYSNRIRIITKVRISDGQMVNNGSKLTFELTAKYGNTTKTIEILQEIRRHGEEKPIILVDLQKVIGSDENKKIYYPNDILDLNMQVKMEPNSSSECFKQTLNIYTGVNVKAVDIIDVKSNAPVNYSRVNDTKESGLFLFKGAPLRFGDEVSFKLRVHFKENMFLPPKMTIANYTLVTEVVCVTIKRSNEVNPHIRKFLNKISVTLADRNSTNITKPSCTTIVELKENQDFYQCKKNQLSSSSSSDPEDKLGVTMSVVSGTRPSQVFKTILFTKLTYIDRIFLASLNLSNKIKKLNICTTDDGKSFQNILTVNGNNTDIRIEDAKFGPLISTRGLRFIVTEFEDTSKDFDFTATVYGCTAPWDPFIFDVCTKTFVEKKPERNLMKSFLSTKELLIHCGLSPVIYRKETYTKRCFLTTSRMPFKWTDFGPRISEVAMLLKPSNTIVAQSDNISAFISDDMGFTWKVINQFLMKQMMIRSSEIIYSTKMTQYYARKTYGEDFINTMCEGNNNDDWKICANGIAYGSKLITDWSSHNFTLPLHI